MMLGLCTVNHNTDRIRTGSHWTLQVSGVQASSHSCPRIPPAHYSVGAKAEWPEFSCCFPWPLHSVGKWYKKIGKLNGGRVNPHIDYY